MDEMALSAGERGRSPSPDPIPSSIGPAPTPSGPEKAARTAVWARLEQDFEWRRDSWALAARLELAGIHVSGTDCPDFAYRSPSAWSELSGTTARDDAIADEITRENQRDAEYYSIPSGFNPSSS